MGGSLLQWDETGLEFSFGIPSYGFGFWRGYRLINSTGIPVSGMGKYTTDALGNPVTKWGLSRSTDLVNGLTGPQPRQLGEEIDQPYPAVYIYLHGR